MVPIVRTVLEAVLATRTAATSTPVTPTASTAASVVDCLLVFLANIVCDKHTIFFYYFLI